MNKHPIHNVEYDKNVGLMPTTPGAQVMLGGKMYEILDGDPGYKGIDSYMVVQTKTVDGKPWYVAYTNDKDGAVMQELMDRMAQTHRQEETRQQEAEQLNYSYQTESAQAAAMVNNLWPGRNASANQFEQVEGKLQPPTAQELLAQRHCVGAKNNPYAYHSIKSDPDVMFALIDEQRIYHMCDFEDIKRGNNIMMLGESQDQVTGLDGSTTRYFEVTAAERANDIIVIKGYEFDYNPDGTQRYMGPCMVTNLSLSNEIAMIRDMGEEYAFYLLDHRCGLAQFADSREQDQPEIERA